MRNYLSLGLTLLLVSLAGLVAAQQRQATQQPEGDAVSVSLQLMATGLTSPVFLTSALDNSGRLFIVDRIGQIRILMPDGTLRAQPFLDVRDRLVQLDANFDERGLLGLAFHPNYVENGRFFVYYSAPLRNGAPPGWNHTSRISEFRVSADPHRADIGSESIILQVDQPQANHNGGTLAFSPTDGYLYISLGDGGGANDTGLGHFEDWFPDNGGGNGQNITDTLLGSILRLDVNNGNPYTIPPDNPFVGTPAKDEIYAYGFRNPYRFSFDKGGKHELLVGDVGQNLWEEVNLVVSGGNYGWNVREGTHCFDAENPNMPPDSCPDMAPGDIPLRDPVIEYANGNNSAGISGLAVVGGYIYRGSELPALSGRYVFGDWSRSFSKPDGSLFVATPQETGLWPVQPILINGKANGRLGHFVLGFGQDRQGELYVLTTDNVGPTGNTGQVWKINGVSRVYLPALLGGG